MDVPANPRSESTVHLTSEMVRALAHPIRAQLLAALRTSGPATASSLAEQLGTNSGATSYHLRQLADVGLVEEDPERGNRRDRWWKAAHRSHSWRDTEHDQDPADREAADWLVRNAHRLYGRQVERWHDRRTEWPNEWRDAADQSDFRIHVTAAELAELDRRLHELVTEYDRGPDDTEPGVEAVTVLLYTYPADDSLR
jgi:DNA-binding transcriptional ArsR family regulator